MKNKKQIAIIFLSLFSLSIKAQKKPPVATFDCAKNDSILYVADAKNCKKLILTGTTCPNCKIVQAHVTMILEDKEREFVIKNESLNADITIALNKLSEGDLNKSNKIFIKEVIVEIPQDGKPAIARKLPTTKVLLKK